MSSGQRNLLFLLAVLVTGLVILAPGFSHGSVELMTRAITSVNVILLLTSLSCLSHYFWPGEENHTPFQLFNLVFAIVFYTFGLNFLIDHKDFYDGYATLSDWQAIKRFTLRLDVFSIMFWIVAFTCFMNVVYMARNTKRYLQYNW